MRSRRGMNPTFLPAPPPCGSPAAVPGGHAARRNGRRAVRSGILAVQSVPSNQRRRCARSSSVICDMAAGGMARERPAWR